MTCAPLHCTGSECFMKFLQEVVVVDAYFRQLDPVDVSDLFDIYADDFRLFGYTFQFGNLTFPT